MVSVITVTYNAEAFIERTVESVVRQTYQDIEYIIMDGASKDRTLDIVRRYGDKISLLVSEPDKGLYDAMNKALDRATGEYVIFLNAGDQFADDYTLEKALQNANGADFIYGDTIVVKEDGTTLHWHKKTPKAEQLSPQDFLQGMVICHQSMLVRRSCAARYDLSWKIAGDIHWTISTLRNCQKKHYIGAPMSLFLFGGISDVRRKAALKERFRIGVKHFGWPPTLWAHVLILLGAVRRGSVAFKE